MRNVDAAFIELVRITDFHLRLTARNALVPISVVISILVIAHVALGVFTAVAQSPAPSLVRRFLDLNADEGIATLFSTLLLSATAVLVALIGADARMRRSWETRYWFALTVALVLAAIDQAESAHIVSKALVPESRLALGVRSLAWTVPYLAAIPLLAFFFSPFLRRLPTSTRRDFLFAISLYLLAKVGGEGVDRFTFGRSGFFAVAIATTLLIAKTAEMFGIAYFLGAILNHLERRGHPLELRISVPSVRERDREVPLAQWQRADRERVREEREVRQ